MSSMNNTTFQVTDNETTLDQQYTDCHDIVASDSTVEKTSKLWGYYVILLGSFFGNAFIIAIVYKRLTSNAPYFETIMTTVEEVNSDKS